MPRDDARSTVRVGLLVLVALGALGAGVFLIGEQNNLFRSMNAYTVELASVSGLQAGNPVQLDGVDVGRVDAIVLPRDPAAKALTVRLLVDARYAERLRGDSLARIKTLGLLGDKYVELVSGTPQAPVIPDGGEIPASPPTNVDQLIASGEDAVENIVGISVSLSTILERLERGEGMLGQLMAPLPADAEGPPLSESLPSTLASIDRVAARLDRDLESGRGPLPRLLRDRQLGDQLARSVERLDRLTAQVADGEGLVPGLLRDPEMLDRFRAALDNLETTSASLRAAAATLEDADGLLPRLLFDQAYADEVTGELRQILERLNDVTGKLADGEGTAGRLIEDPEVYEAVQDILVGVEESRLLRWLIRNRQRKGIEVRYERESGRPADAPPPAEGGTDEAGGAPTP